LPRVDEARRIEGVHNAPVPQTVEIPLGKLVRDSS
jgi:hypothetical protein